MGDAKVSGIAAVGIAAATLAIGLLVGRQWRTLKQPAPVILAKPPVRAVTPPPSLQSQPKVAKLDTPKPPVLAPDVQPDLDPSTPLAVPGNLPHLPPAPLSGGIGPVSASVPLSPDLPTLPVADLKADEAAIRRLVIQYGGQVQTAQEAKDTSGTVGRSLVVDVPATVTKDLRSALTAKLHDRVIITETGLSSSDPTLKKAEDELAAAKKERDQARIDFLPQAPALRQIEERYAALEKSVIERRGLLGRTRLNILLRPALS